MIGPDSSRTIVELLLLLEVSSCLGFAGIFPALPDEIMVEVLTMFVAQGSIWQLSAHRVSYLAHRVTYSTDKVTKL